MHFHESMNQNLCILIKISLKFVPNGPIDNKSVLLKRVRFLTAIALCSCLSGGLWDFVNLANYTCLSQRTGYERKIFAIFRGMENVLKLLGRMWVNHLHQCPVNTLINLFDDNVLTLCAAWFNYMRNYQLFTRRWTSTIDKNKQIANIP